MKEFGVLFLIVGVIWVLIAFNMDTTVSTGVQYIEGIAIPSQTVHNIGKMDERRNHLMMSALLIVVGIILFAFGNRGQTDNSQSKQPQILENTKKCPFCAETIKTEAITCRFCQKNLPPVDFEKEKSIKTNL